MTRIHNAITNDEIAVFDEEMAFLSSIQTRFLNMHNRIPVAHDDPDVKHLTEAMAAFMAKGRMAGRQQIDQLHQRVFQQLMPYLAMPVVSMAQIQADTRYLSEATKIKAGSLFTLSSDDDEQAQYRSVCDMPLAPIGIERIGCKAINRIENQVLIRIKSHTRAPGKLEHLPLFLNVNDNFNLSVWLKQLLQEQLVSVSAVFDETGVFEGKYKLGACQADNTLVQRESVLIQAALQSYDLHPIEKIRSYFQLPQQENYLNLYFAGTPQQWTNCDLIFTLKGQWPKQLKISGDFFQLGVISVENIIQEQAEPINYNATQSNSPIRAPSTANDLSFLKCLGVYKGALKDRDILRPGILKGGDGAYDLYFQNSSLSGVQHPQLDIHLPEAFKKPIKITIDALWHQPEFSKHLWKQLKVGAHHLDIRGLSWNIFNSPVAYVPLSASDPQSLLELSLLKNKRELSLDEIVFILESCGSVFKREFYPIKNLLKSLHVSSGIDNNRYKSESGNIYRQSAQYIFSLSDMPSNFLPVINAFFAKVETLLNVWIADVTISVKIQNNSPAIEQVESNIDNNYALIENLEIPIYNYSDSEKNESDYLLIPGVPEKLFFIEKQSTRLARSSGANKYEQ